MTEVKTSILSCVYLVLGMTLHSGIFNLFVSKALFYFVFLQSMMLLAPKLSEKTINNQLLKYFAKLQMDQEVLAVYVSCYSSVVMERFSLDCIWDIVKTSHIFFFEDIQLRNVQLRNVLLNLKYLLRK